MKMQVGFNTRKPTSVFLYFVFFFLVGRHWQLLKDNVYDWGCPGQVGTWVTGCNHTAMYRGSNQMGTGTWNGDGEEGCRVPWVAGQVRRRRQWCDDRRPDLRHRVGVGQARLHSLCRLLSLLRMWAVWVSVPWCQSVWCEACGWGGFGWEPLLFVHFPAFWVLFSFLISFLNHCVQRPQWSFQLRKLYNLAIESIWKQKALGLNPIFVT